MQSMLRLPDVLAPQRPPAPTPERVPEPPRAHAQWAFLRAFRRALTDENTFDLRRNPAIWLGFLLAVPIPLLAFAADAPGWLLLVSIPAPVAWAVVLGAAGRVGILSHLEQQRLMDEVRRAMEEHERTQASLAQESARRAALEERAKEVLSELRLAQSVHSTLVPPNVQRTDVEVAVRQIPCQFVGGDYLHASVVDDRWLYLCVADVSGHGIAAALVVARVHGLVRRFTLERRSPESILEQLNRSALTIFKHTHFFMTFGVFRLDLKTGVLDYATAGHPAQVLLRADGRMETLRTPNRLLGMDADIFDTERPTDRIQLEPGDSLVLFTDGLFEILGGKDGDLLDESELHARIKDVRGLSPFLMAGEILQEMADFQGTSEFGDDVSVMVARYRDGR
jgi:sigma-B regulation protein RsbU (phosphoserine phosphatase)